MIDFRRYWQGQVADERFPLVQYVGGTRNSAVFLTECAESRGRSTAIKLIPAPAENAGAQLTRWELVAKFSHPHLLRVYHSGRCTMDNAPMLYVVMEYGEENLAEILSQRALSSAETRDLLGPALEALAYLHSKGFVHGHIQPSNIMAAGEVIKISSDGISRFGESVERVNGKNPYSAPECAVGAFSAASDVWSLGVTLVECLTRQLSMVEEGGRVMASAPADLPAPFLKLARHCLSEAPERRWDVAAMQEYLRRNPVEAEVEEVAPAVRATPQPHSRRRYVLPLTALGFAVATILLGMTLFGPNRNTRGIRSTGPESSVEQPKAEPPKIAGAKAKASPTAKLPQTDRQSVAGVEVHRSIPATPATSLPAATGDVVQGGVVHRELPDVPKYASDTIWGTVRVRVRVEVDPSGNVVESALDSAGPSRYFARLSLNAARGWRFGAPDGDTKSVPNEWVIRFDYTKSATTASATPQNP